MGTPNIRVRVTALDDDEGVTQELNEAVNRGGLYLDDEDDHRPARWYATQAELDTPHYSFRLSPL